MDEQQQRTALASGDGAMVVALVAALAKNRVIGSQNGLPWRLPADLRRFRRITWGKPLLMGRKTFESIGRALPGRVNVVITHSPTYVARGCVVVPGLAEALRFCKEHGEVMIIGGASIYQQALPMARRMYLTLIHQTFPGDARFPQFAYEDWREVERLDCEPDAANPYPYTFVVLER